MSNIIYIHGYGSCADPASEKVRMLGGMTDEIFLVDTKGRYDPSAYLSEIQKIILQEGEPSFFVGTSLGGFWAWMASIKYQVPFVSLNPVVNPYVQLKDIMDETELATYENLKIPEPFYSIPGLIVLSENDPVLDSKMTEDFFFRTSSLILNIAGSASHSLSDLSDFPHYMEFVRNYIKTDALREYVYHEESESYRDNGEEE